MIKKKDCCTVMVGQFFSFSVAKGCLRSGRNSELPFFFAFRK